MATLPNARVVLSSVSGTTRVSSTKTPLQLVDANGVSTAMSWLRGGGYDRYIGAKHMRTLEQAGYARAGKVDWSKAETQFRRSDVFAMLRGLASRSPG